MRTAVLFFGEVRGCEENWKRLLKLLVVPNNADVFIHGYKYTDVIISKKKEENESYSMFTNNKGIHKTPPESLHKIFSPKISFFEYPPIYENTKISDKIIEIAHANTRDWFADYTGYNAIKNQLYSRKRVIELKMKYEKENGFRYDNVILTRLDFNILKTIRFTDKLTSVKAKKWCDNSIAEQIVAGCNDHINVIKNMYDESDAMYLGNCKSHHFMQNEFYMWLFLYENKIPIEGHDFGSDYSNSKNGLLRYDKDFIEFGETCRILPR
jgi:hypothetical protein